ncbi:T9SS type A sorting domain-containing protein [Flavobacterium sp. ZT3R18]|nr:T9SS type A sorting domain-containing protein [Flavobacterium sp. ZT3R18]
MQEAKFDNQNELQIELQSRLNSGIYILKIITENTIFTDKIILNR